MGTFGEQCAEKYGFTRAEQDAYAIETLTRAQKAVSNGWFDAEIVAVTPDAKTGEVARDENPLKVNPEKIPLLKAAFKENGTVTPASSSANADGAAALVLTRRPEAGQPATERKRDVMEKRRAAQSETEGSRRHQK